MAAVLEVPTIKHPAAASDEERAQLHALDALLERGDMPSVHDTSGYSCGIPDSARQVIHQAVHMLAHGQAVALVPMDALLTTQEAADILNVSRTYLLRLLSQDKISYTKTGTHRRLLWEDVMAYKKQHDADRLKARERLVRLTEALQLYDED